MNTRGWRETQLGELVEVVHGCAFKGEFFEQGGETRLVTPGNFLEGGGFRDRGSAQKSYRGPVPSKYVLAPGALVVAMTEQSPGLLGSSALIPDDGMTWLHNQRIGLVRPRDQATSPAFLYHLFNTPEVRSQISATATGTKIRHTAPERIAAVRVRVPNPGLQGAIGSVLSAFDDLFVINDRRMGALEDLARALYREWFVPASPAGVMKTIADVSAVFRGIAPRYSEAGRSLVVNQRCIRDQRLSLAPARRQDRHVPPAKQLRYGDVLINSTGVGTLGRVAVFLSARRDVTADSHVTICRPTSADAIPWFALHMLSLEPKLKTMGAGSTGQTELSRQAIGALPVAVPPPSTLGQFSSIATPLMDLVPALSRCNDALATTRALLRPRLVTGRLDISDVDLGDLLPAELA